MNKFFFSGILLILIIYFLAVWIISGIYQFDATKLNSLMFSGIISTMNIIVAFVIVKYSINKSAQAFNKAFLISMGIRFITLLAVIFAILKFAEVDQLAFLISLFLLYFTFQFLEVIVVNKHLNRGKST